MLNLKNNPILILNLCCQLTLKKFNLLALVLNPKEEPSGLKDYNNLNKVDTNNISSFIDYITTNKQVEGCHEVIYKYFYLND